MLDPLAFVYFANNSKGRGGGEVEGGERERGLTEKREREW